MSAEKGRGDLLGAVAGLVGASSLGYELTANPQGFVLAVVYEALVGILTGFANSVAYRADQAWGMLTEAVVGGLAHALGTPGRVIGGLVLGAIDTAQAYAADLAEALGPIGIIVIPAMWAVVIVGSVALLAGSWRLYKWLRTVIV